MRLVLVDWIDSYGAAANWQSIENYSPSPMRCQSVGWIVSKNKDSIAVVPHLSEKGHPDVPQQGCGDMTIPKSAIVRIQTLTPTRRKA